MYEKKFITTDPEAHSKCMNNFVKQSFADSKQKMIIFFLSTVTTLISSSM